MLEVGMNSSSSLTCMGEGPLRLKMATRTPVSILTLPGDMLWYILQYVDIEDRIAFAYACEGLRQICQNEGLFRKLDLRRFAESKQQGPIRQLFRDKQMAQSITELNLNNQRLRKWQTDADLVQFIVSCTQLQALHVLHCGISLKSLHRILRRAPKLVALSFSIMDLTLDDILFMMQDRNSARGISLKRIKHLRIEIPLSSAHIQVSKYLVISCCKNLEELELHYYNVPSTSQLQTNNLNPFLRLRSRAMEKPLENFHSLTMLGVVNPNCCERCAHEFIFSDLSKFLMLLVRKKSPNTKWKKLWISPPLDNILNLHNDSLAELDSPEILSASMVRPHEHGLQMLFERMNNSVIRKLKIGDLECFEHFSDPISRIGGDALEYLSVYHIIKSGNIDLDANLSFDKVFSSCKNIREINLMRCHFARNICGALSKLKHLRKVVLQECAIAPDHMNEGDEMLLTFVRNCRYVTDFDLRGCTNPICRCTMDDEDLEVIKEWKELESLTLVDVRSIGGEFLSPVRESCKSLTTLRVYASEYFIDYATILTSVQSLRHLAIHACEADLGIKEFWTFLSEGKSLERLCIKTGYFGSINVNAAVKMVKRMKHLHMMHLHLLHRPRNLRNFWDRIIETLEKENSTRTSHFEFVIHIKDNREQYWSYKPVLPMNASEMCFLTPSTELPTV